MAAFGSIHLGGLAGGYGSKSIPPLAAGVDYLLDDRISVGGLVGFSQTSFSAACFPRSLAFTPVSRARG